MREIEIEIEIEKAIEKGMRMEMGIGKVSCSLVPSFLDVHA